MEFVELSNESLYNVIGGFNWLKTIGGAIIVVAGIAQCATGVGALTGTVTIIGGAACLWDGITS